MMEEVWSARPAICAQKSELDALPDGLGIDEVELSYETRAPIECECFNMDDLSVINGSKRSKENNGLVRL